MQRLWMVTVWLCLLTWSVPVLAGDVLRHSTPCEVQVGPFGSTNLRGEWRPTDDLAEKMTVMLSVNGGAMAPRVATEPIKYDRDGFYIVVLSEEDTGEHGRLDVVVVSGAGPPLRRSFGVMFQTEWDRRFAAKVKGGGADYTADVIAWNGGAVASTTDGAGKECPTVDVTLWGGTMGIDGTVTNGKIIVGIVNGGITSATLADNCIGNTEIAANAIGSSELATGCITADQMHATANAEIATAVAADILVTPANMLATDASGRVDLGKILGTAVSAYVPANINQFFNVTPTTSQTVDEVGSGGGGDATAANQTTIISHLTDVKGATWASTDSLEAIRNQGDAEWTTATGFAEPGDAMDLIADALDASSLAAAAVDEIAADILQNTSYKILGNASGHVTLADGPHGGMSSSLTLTSYTSFLANTAPLATTTQLNARTLAAADYFLFGSDTVANVGTTASVSGNVSGSVGSISGITFPTNFDDLAITATTGRVDVGEILGTAVSTYVPANINQFFNVTPTTSQTVDDVGSGGGGDATEANQTSILAHLVGIKGLTWDSTNSLESISDSLFDPSADTVDVGKILGTAVTANAPGAINYFFNIGSPSTTIDDVGVAGTMDANLIQINGTSIAGTSTQVADSWLAYWNVASPTFSSGTALSGFKADVTDMATETYVSGRTLAAADYFLFGSDTVVNVGTTASVSGNVTGSVGSISGVTFPTNFDDLAITATTGRVDVGEILGTAVSTYVPANFNQFFNVTPTTSNTVDNVGEGAGTTPAAVWEYASRTLSGTINDFDELDTALDTAHGAGSWVDAGGLTAVAIREEIDSNSTKLIDILADTNELQTDDVPGLIAALDLFDPTSDKVFLGDGAHGGLSSSLTLTSYSNFLANTVPLATTTQLNSLEAHGDTTWATAAGFAEPGDAMDLIADAIGAANFDESTAWPLTAADTGATAVARTGADSDTLETLSDEIAALHNFDPTSDTVDVDRINGTTLDADFDENINFFYGPAATTSKTVNDVGVPGASLTAEDVWTYVAGGGRSLTVTADANLVSIDGEDTDGNNATLYLKAINIVNDAGPGFYAQGSTYGMHNTGGTRGMFNYGTQEGMYNWGNQVGQTNNGGTTYGVSNYGNISGERLDGGTYSVTYADPITDGTATVTIAELEDLVDDWKNAGRLDALVDAILADTAEIGAAGAGLSAIPWNAAWDAEVAQELADIHLDHLMAVAVTGGDVADNSVIAKLAADDSTADWDTFDNTTHSLEAIRIRGDNEWITGGGAASPALLLDTTVAIVYSQTQVTLSTGSDQDDAYNGATIILEDASNSDFPSLRTVTDYVGLSKTLVIDAAPGFDTDMIAGDGVVILAADRTLDQANAIDGKTVRQLLRYLGAVVAGETSGAGSGTEVFKGVDGLTDRVRVIIDSNGDRTTVTYDP